MKNSVNWSGMDRFTCIILSLFLIYSISCAAGPTPERTGFDYPEAGVKYSPRRHVTTDTIRGNIASSDETGIRLLIPRTTSQVESPDVRLLTTGIYGKWNYGDSPLYDQVSLDLFRADQAFTFRKLEEREIEVPWSGLENPYGTLRTWEMVPLSGGSTVYCLAVTVEHYGNTFEFLWRDGSTKAPDDEKLEIYFYWTRGLKFTEPEPSETDDQ